MRIMSSWEFNCLPEDIYPNFFCATMDDSYPFAFHLGIPKPLSCTVLEGEPKIGNTRQCTTDRGYIRQRIVELEENRKLVYRMQESDVWCKNWVSIFQDHFLLQPLGNDHTKVIRITEFHGVKHLPLVSSFALWFSLKQAHKYAAKNWLRLAKELKHQRTIGNSAIL